MTDSPPAQQHMPAADHNGGAEPPAEAAGGKRKRSTKLEKLQKDVTDLESRHTLSEAKVSLRARRVPERQPEEGAQEEAGAAERPHHEAAD